MNTDKQCYYPGESIRFSVNTFNACSNKLMQMSGVAYIALVGYDGKPVLKSKIRIDDAIGSGTLFIDDNITSGAYNIVVYTNWMRNFGQSTFANKPVLVVNPVKPAAMNVDYVIDQDARNEPGNLKLELTKKEYSKRESVIVKISAGKAIRATVSVYRIDQLETGSQHGVMSKIADPCHAIVTTKAKYSVENEGQVIIGKVTDKQTHLPAKGIRYYLSTSGFPAMFSTAVSDSAGIIRFLAGNLEGKNELVIQPDPAMKNNFSIELTSPFQDNWSTAPAKGNEDVFTKNESTIDDAMISTQVRNIFSGEHTIDTHDTTGKIVFYSRPDAYYLMSDYVHFNSVEEILREIVTTVNMRKRHGKLFPVVLNLYSKKPYSKPPLILLNGVPVFDVDLFLKMNTDDFYSISVKARPYYVGGAEFEGILDVRTKSALLTLPAEAQVVDFEGIQPKAVFASPEYTNDVKRADRKPDFRNVLYWNPQIETETGDASIEFYTSDLEGEYMVVVEAISKDGQISLNKASLHVK